MRRYRFGSVWIRTAVPNVSTYTPGSRYIRLGFVGNGSGLVLCKNNLSYDLNKVHWYLVEMIMCTVYLFIIRLVARAGKMKQSCTVIGYLRDPDGAILPSRDCPLPTPLFTVDPNFVNNKFLISQVCSVKIVEYSPRFCLVCLWTEFFFPSFVLLSFFPSFIF